MSHARSFLFAECIRGWLLDEWHDVAQVEKVVIKEVIKEVPVEKIVYRDYRELEASNQNFEVEQKPIKKLQRVAPPIPSGAAISENEVVEQKPIKKLQRVAPPIPSGAAISENEVVAARKHVVGQTSEVQTKARIRSTSPPQTRSPQSYLKPEEFYSDLHYHNQPASLQSTSDFRLLSQGSSQNQFQPLTIDARCTSVTRRVGVGLGLKRNDQGFFLPRHRASLFSYTDSLYNQPH
jgi:hypothetical protein